MTPLEEYFERIRQAHGIELVGTVGLRDETDGGRQSEDKENDHDA